MPSELPPSLVLPPDARPAVAIVRRLADAGHQAVLAGGCVRDLLLGGAPHDYDVATDAPPQRVLELFRASRQVGMQFGVVLVKQHRRWVEVATFRSDGPYLDGRRPATVTLTDAQHDAFRRDFTVNGMFLDPLAGRIVDYVGGQVDLHARVIRAIGMPAARFEEDHLRLLRAVRFAARLGFEIEPTTLAATQQHAAQLARVAPERVRDELEKMLAHPARARAWSLLSACGLRPYLWPGAAWTGDQSQRCATLLRRLPQEAPAALALAVLLEDRPADEIERVARALTLSNEQREMVLWLVAHQTDCDDPAAPTLPQLKRLMANPAFAVLCQWAAARHADYANGAARQAALQARLAGIRPEAVAPTPLVTGDDLLSRGVPPGQVYKQVLEALYTRQLAEELTTREQAVLALEELLRGVAVAGRLRNPAAPKSDRR